VPEDKIDVLIQIGAQALVQKQLSTQLKRATMIIGIPNTGKSKLKNLLGSTLGTRSISSVSLQDISDDPFVTGALEKSVLNFKDDMDRVPLQSVSNFKDFTGDAANHMINRKMESQYPGNINCGWAFTCNFPPSVTEKIKRDTAFWKRWNLVFFNNVFPDVDADFEKRTYTPSLRSSFLKCIVNMIIVIRKTGHLVVEQPVEYVMSEWLSRCDSVSDFLETGLFVDVERGDDPIYYIKESLFNVYQQVSVGAGFESENILQNKTAFYSTMQNHGFIPTRKESSEFIDGKAERRTYECFKSWLRPAGNKMNDGHYHIKLGQINPVSHCLFENKSVDLSNILEQTTTRVCG
jgi:phage/plasmid-associated DNA primase